MSPATVLVVNAGSSSLKYQLVRPDSGMALTSGLVERIGLSGGAARHEVMSAAQGDEGGQATDRAGTRHTRAVDVADHQAAFEVLRQMFAEHGPDLAQAPPVAVGHRVVHGGSRFSEPTVVDDEVLEALRALIPLAPLHNPGNVIGIEVSRRVFPEVPQVAVFDTAFHQSMPAAAYTYAVPAAWREEHGVRRYGFHGTSHAYVSRRVAELRGQPIDELNTVVLHLGNGASACAVAGGRSVDTSMGLTPLEGLVMGTRPGDLDPGIAGHMTGMGGLNAEEYDRALNKESGLLGLCGTSDFREVMERRSAGDEAAALAFDVVVHRLVRHLGALALVLSRLDAVAFTAGIGEHNPLLRAAVLGRAAALGVELDERANAEAAGEALVTTPNSRVAAYVVPTNEEHEIARQAAHLVSGWGHRSP